MFVKIPVKCVFYLDTSNEAFSTKELYLCLFNISCTYKYVKLNLTLPNNE